MPNEFVVKNGLISQNNITVTGSINATAGITGSLSGTATTASYVATAQTASYVATAVSATTAQTASYVLNAVSASRAATSSYANGFTVAGTLTAQTLVVQTITSSVDFVTGSTKFGSISSNTHQFTGSVGISGSLNVLGVSTLNTATVSSLTVTGSGTIASYNSDVLEITGSLVVSGSSTITGSLDVNGGITGSLLGTASYALSASYAPGGGGGNSFPYTGSAIISGSLELTGSQNITGSLSVTGSTLLSGSLELIGSQNITGSSTLTGSLNITGSSTFTGSVDITGSSTLTGSLNVTGSQNITGSTTLTGSLNVTGSTTLTGSLELTGSQNITGSSTLTGSFNITGSQNITGSTTLTGSLELTGSQTITGSTTLTGSLNTTGSTVLTGSLGVTGSTTLTGSLGITGSTILTGSLDITGSSTLTGSLNTTGSTVLTGSLDVTGSTTLTGSLGITGSTLITGSLELTGSTIFSGSLNITGSTTLTGSLNVTGSSTLTGSLGITGSTLITGSLELTGSTVLSGSLNITGSTVLTGSLDITGSSTLTGSLNISGSLTTTDTITAQTLVVQTITSSVDFVTGSTRFGSILENTHVFSGSVTMNPGGLFVSSSGVVGIGTSTPISLLHLQSGNLTIAKTAIGSATEVGNIEFRNDHMGNYPWAQIKAVNGGTHDFSNITFSTTHGFNSMSEKMRITSIGNVGIGTISPDTTLHVSSSSGIKIQATGNSDTPSLTIINHTNQYGWARFGGGLQGNGKGYASISCWNASTVAEIIRISGDGNVGIGVTPSYALDVANSSSPSLRVRNGALGGTSTLLLETANDFSGTCQTYIKCIGTSSNGRSELAFGTSGAVGDATATERMRITSGGDLKFGNTGQNGQFIYGNSNEGYLSISGGEAAGTSYGANITLVSNSRGSANIRGELSLSAGNTGGAGSYINFITNAAEQMRITSNGNINFNDTVYNNTAVATTRILYIGSDYRIGGISSIRESKKNIQNLSNVNWIYSLNPVTFNYRKKDEQEQYTDEIYDELVYGLIAEDTQPIADFLINYNDKKEMIGIEYMRLITPMLKAIQEQQTQIESQNTLIQELTTRLTALENK